MWAEISNLIGANPSMTLVIIILGTTTIWMYKEFKEMINQNNKAKILSINEKIKVYSQLQVNTACILYDKGQGDLELSLIIKLGEYSPLLSEDMRRVAKDYYRNRDSAYLETMLAFIEVDLKKLDIERKKYSRYDSITDISEFVMKLYDPLKPIVMIWIFIWFFLMCYTIYQAQEFWYYKLFVLLCSISIFISATLVAAIISLIMNNEISRPSSYKWYSLVGTIVFVPLLIFLHLSFSVLSLVIQLMGAYLLVRIKKKKNGEIITFS